MSADSRSNGKRCLMIVGAGIEQLRAYESAREMGIETVASDINPNAPGFSVADYGIIASTRDSEETVSMAKEFDSKKRIDGVMTIANDVPLTVARVAAELGLPGISVDSARLASSKILMKEKFVKEHIPTPPFHEIHNPDELKDFARYYSYPIMVKPDDGRGARGVLMVTADIDPEWSFYHAMDNSDDKRVLAEKFVAGPQLSTESMVYRGRTYTAAISERNYEFAEKYSPYVIENGGTLPADLEPVHCEAVETVIRKVAEAMGIENGTIKGDIVMTSDGPVVIEFATRLSGGYLATDQIPLARGVDLVKQTVKLALGEELDTAELIPKDLGYIGIRYFFPKPGRIDRIEGFDELDKMAWLSKKMMFLGEGDVVEYPTNHTKRAGFVHAVGSTFEEATRRAVRAVNMVRIKTVPV